MRVTYTLVYVLLGEAPHDVSVPLERVRTCEALESDKKAAARGNSFFTAPCAWQCLTNTSAACGTGEHLTRHGNGDDMMTRIMGVKWPDLCRAFVILDTTTREPMSGHQKA